MRWKVEAEFSPSFNLFIEKEKASYTLHWDRNVIFGGGIHHHHSTLLASLFFGSGCLSLFEDRCNISPSPIRVQTHWVTNYKSIVEGGESGGEKNYVYAGIELVLEPRTEKEKSRWKVHMWRAHKIRQELRLSLSSSGKGKVERILNVLSPLPSKYISPRASSVVPYIKQRTNCCSLPFLNSRTLELL